MKIVQTSISTSYKKLIETFIKANELNINIEERIVEGSTALNTQSCLNLLYEENSETALQITFMSTKHLGFENMLCDYLIKCGIPSNRITIGGWALNRDMKELDRQWEERRRELGFR